LETMNAIVCAVNKVLVGHVDSILTSVEATIRLSWIGRSLREHEKYRIMQKLRNIC